MKYILSGALIFQLLGIGVNAQADQRLEIADGTKIPFGTTVYLAEAETVSNKVKSADIDLPKFEGSLCGEKDPFRILDSLEGNFTAKNIKVKAYLYTDCSNTSKQLIQGIILISNTSTTVSHFIYPYSSDVKLSRVPDLDGNGIDELAIYSYAKTNVGHLTMVRLLEFGTNGPKKLGLMELQNDKDILTARKLFAERGDPPRFYLSELKTDGSRWRKVESEQRTELSEDPTNYTTDKSGRSLLRHLWVWTFLLQLAAFAALIAFVIYDLFSSVKTSEVVKDQKPRLEAGTDTPATDDHLPKLDPINCNSCGAGLPLVAGTMVCSRCGSQTAAPADYFDVAQKRGDINGKIRSAAAYIKKARWLTSGWVRYGMLFLVLWLVAALVGIVMLFSKGDLDPYRSFLSSKLIFGAGSFSNCFWIVSLLLGFAVWGPRLKKVLPVIELPARIGQIENAQCLQCGGAIQYAADDLATVCRYCGVETYRAKLAWKMRNLTNQVDKKASFSLIEAKRSVEDAVWGLTGTPRVFAFLLILVGILGAIVWLTGSVYERLPAPVRDVFDLIGDILGAF